LQDKLSTTKFDDFNDLVNIAICAEHKMKKLDAKNKRPAPNSVGGSSSCPLVGPHPPPPRAPGAQPPRPMWVVRLLSVKIHRRAATCNTRSREAPRTAGGSRSLGQRPRSPAHALAW
jgi:hypothetical protein